MKKVILSTAFLTIISLSNYAQMKTKKKLIEDEKRLNFSEWGAYYGNGTATNTIGTSTDKHSIGNTVGLIANNCIPYDLSIKDENLMVGWSAKFAAGWNLTTQKAAKWDAEIGIWASRAITNHIEVGLQYSFMGVYSYQNISFFGSSMEAAIRAYDFQLSYSRDGEGVFSGCISPKTSGFGTNGFGIKYFIRNKFFTGVRFTNYSNVSEYAIAVGLISL